jgi:hypothetical protein
MEWILYLIRLLFTKIGDFLRHWYISSFYLIADLTIKLLEALDRTLALRVSVRYWLYPLYQERNAVGYIVGFFARTVRIVFATVVYVLIIVVVAGIYLLWATLPFWLIYKTIQAYGIKTDIF